MTSSARDIAGELLRVATEDNRYVRHLLADGIRPLPPRCLAGVPGDKVVQTYEDLVRASK